MERDDRTTAPDNKGSDPDPTEGPGNVSVDEPTEPVLDPEDKDLEDGSSDPSQGGADDRTS